MSIIETFGPTAATLDGGLAGLAYLQYHQIANINWNKLQTVS